MRKPPPPGTPVSLALIEDQRSLGQNVLTSIRGKIGGEPAGVSESASQWWFMLGWVMRGMAVGLPKDDPAMVFDAFEQFTFATGESKVKYDA
jgi:hypothetical protein